jgi:hypothetical protein
MYFGASYLFWSMMLVPIAVSLSSVRCLVAVHNSASSRRREHAIAVGKERREALMRVCRAPLFGSDKTVMEEGDMVIDEEKADLEARTAQAVEELKSALSTQYVSTIEISLCVNITLLWVYYLII